jgi:hypothetical protein
MPNTSARMLFRNLSYGWSMTGFMAMNDRWFLGFSAAITDENAKEGASLPVNLVMP